MTVKPKDKITTKEIEQLKKKAAIFDEFIEFVEDKGLAHLMKKIEKEENIPLNKAGNIF